MSSSSVPPTQLTQEKIENFFYKVMAELRDENIPILNNFYEIFANIKFEDELVKLDDNEEEEEEEFNIIDDENNK
jgi:hypothetical protein